MTCLTIKLANPKMTAPNIAAINNITEVGNWRLRIDVVKLVAPSRLDV